MGVEQEPSTNLTVEQCEALAAALFEDAAILPPGSEKEELLRLAQGYRSLATIKRLILRKVN
jgi:hypothetical protein